MPVPAHQAGPAPTARRRSASKSARTGASASRRTRASASTAGSTPIVRRPFVLLLAVMVAIVPGPIPVRAPRSGLARTVAPLYVNRSARTAGDVLHQIPANVPRSGTATTAVSRSATRASSRPTVPRKRVLEYQRAIPRSVSTCGRGPGPCTGLVFSRSGVIIQKASTAPSRNGRIRSWRPSPVRTIYMSLVFETGRNVAIVSK